MFELIFILFLVLVALIVLGLFFKGEAWKPSFTMYGKRVTMSIAVPQVAFKIYTISDAPPSLNVAGSVAPTPPTPPQAK